MSSNIALRFGRQPEMLNVPFFVSTLVGYFLFAKYEYHEHNIRVEGRDTLANLIVPDVIDFDVFIGMDWISPRYVTVDYHAKIVKFENTR